MTHALESARRLRTIGLAAVALAAASAVHAQTAGYSVLPWTQQGHVGLNVGKPDYSNSCGAGPSCDDADAALHLYTGGMFNRWLGLEAGDPYGADVGYDFGSNSSVVLEYARHQFHFAGVGREPVETTSVRYIHRF